MGSGERGLARRDQQATSSPNNPPGGPPALSQLREPRALVAGGFFGTPPPAGPASIAMTEHCHSARAAILDYFRADPAEYEAIFTANASAGLKIVGESYPFGRGGVYALLFDNHNSVNGIREFAKARGAEVRYVPIRK